MDAASRKPVQVQRLDGDERLPLTGLHLRDVALVEDDPAHELDVEEAYADRPAERLADGRVGLEDQVLERLAVLEALLELGGLPAELVVRELLEVGLERPDVRGLLGEPLETASFTETQELLETTVAVAWHGLRVPARVAGARRPSALFRSPDCNHSDTRSRRSGW